MTEGIFAFILLVVAVVTWKTGHRLIYTAAVVAITFTAVHGNGPLAGMIDSVLGGIKGLAGGLATQIGGLIT